MTPMTPMTPMTAMTAMTSPSTGARGPGPGPVPGRRRAGHRRGPRRGVLPRGALLLTLAALPLLLGAADVEAFPAQSGFPSPMAGPASRGFGFSRLAVGDITAADSGDAFYALKLGALFPLVRIDAWRVCFDAGFLGLFDIDRSYDNLGWDGNYGLVVTHPLGPDAAVRFGWLHDSSHVGDEYAERTGRRRIGDTREEYVLGVTWWPAAAWRLYGEYGHGTGYDADDPGEPGRLQAGVEWERDGRWAPYAALDLQSWEERGWNTDVAVQGGLAFHADGRRWRLGLEYHDGRVPLGEFHAEDQRHVSLGIYVDLGYAGPHRRAAGRGQPRASR